MIGRNVTALDRPPAPPYLAFSDVRAAAGRLDGVAHRTPVLSSRTLDERLGARLLLKAESFQRVGAFKFRGAFNAVSSFQDRDRRRGVCTASSGNHAQAVALACAMHAISATILMPEDAPALKRAATEGYGAEVITFDRYSEDREALLQALSVERGAQIVHPYDDPRVMAGQGTAMLELLEQAGQLDTVVIPVGGGGLIAGSATVIRALCPAALIIGVEPEAGDDVARSLAVGERLRLAVAPTIADGQQTAQPGERTWPVIQALVDEVVTVTDDEILATMRVAFQRLKIVLEPSGATALAAVLHRHVDVTGRRVGVILSGGNADPAVFSRALAG